MLEKTIFSGFGGQGIISLGQIWAYCAMKEGKKVSFFPFYGAEKRGGLARASCIISDDTIASPNITKANSVSVMNKDSLETAAKACADGGLMIINSSLISDDDVSKVIQAESNGAKLIKILKIPATDIALKLGNIKIANMVMLGVTAKQTGALMLDSIQTILESFFPKSKHFLIPLNIAAIQAGMSYSPI